MSAATLCGTCGYGARAFLSVGSMGVGRGVGGGSKARRWASLNTLWDLWDGRGVPLVPGRAPILAIRLLTSLGSLSQVPGLLLCLRSAWQGAAAERAHGRAQATCGPRVLCVVCCRVCGRLGVLTCGHTTARVCLTGTSGSVRGVWALMSRVFMTSALWLCCSCAWGSVMLLRPAGLQAVFSCSWAHMACWWAT